jgi:uncharacterized protein (TIGR03084 family)
MNELNDITNDLEAETGELVGLLQPLEPKDWERVTPAEPWTISDQIGHLAYFDEQATLAASDPAAFADRLNETLPTLVEDVGDFHRARGLGGPAILDWFRQARDDLLSAAGDVDPDSRIPWYGPPMRPRSFMVARLMETWAHGTDVAQTLGTTLPATDRLFWIADLGVRTFSWSFANRQLDVPAERVRVALTSPSGVSRVWNEESEQSVSGPAEDFCLVVSQRRHVADTELAVNGTVAARWMEIAQVFAGPPGPGRSPTS